MEREFYERYLPHWYPPGATLFLTMRLAGSLPVEIVAQLQLELRQAREAAKDEQAALQAISRQHFGRFDTFLDAGLPSSPQWLAEPVVIQLVLESMRWISQRGDFALLAACVMPNHLHAVLTLPLELSKPFEDTLRDFKHYTALHANRLLRRTGAFWQPETYDHVLRDSADGSRLARAISYVLNNPVKAGLCREWPDWPGTWCAPT